MKKKLLRPKRVVVEAVGGLVGTDVGPDEEYLAVADFGEALLEADPAFLDGLHFAAHEDDAGLERLEDVVVEVGGLVDGDRPRRSGLRHGPSPRGRA